jgi:hypothetical protein
MIVETIGIELGRADDEAAVSGDMRKWTRSDRRTWTL